MTIIKNLTDPSIVQTYVWEPLNGAWRWVPMDEAKGFLGLIRRGAIDIREARSVILMSDEERRELQQAYPDYAEVIGLLYAKRRKTWRELSRLLKRRACVESAG